MIQLTRAFINLNDILEYFKILPAIMNLTIFKLLLIKIESAKYLIYHQNVIFSKFRCIGVSFNVNVSKSLSNDMKTKLLKLV